MRKNLFHFDRNVIIWLDIIKIYINYRTCTNYFQKGFYVFNISKIQERCACVTRVDLNTAIKVTVFENSLPLKSTDVIESAALART